MDGQGDVVKATAIPQVLNFEEGCAGSAGGCGGRCAGVGLEFAADHVANHLLDGGIPGEVRGDERAIAQDDDAIGDALDFIEAMGDVKDCDAFSAKPIEMGEEALDFGFGEAGGGFVENEEL